MHLRGDVALQFVANQNPRRVTSALDELAEKRSACLSVTPALHENVAHLAILIGCTPQVTVPAPMVSKIRHALTMRQNPGDVQVAPASLRTWYPPPVDGDASIEPHQISYLRYVPVAPELVGTGSECLAIFRDEHFFPLNMDIMKSPTKPNGRKLLPIAGPSGTSMGPVWAPYALARILKFGLIGIQLNLCVQVQFSRKCRLPAFVHCSDWRPT